MSESNSDELEKRVHALFGDSQVYDGGYHSCYDGKWVDMTNEVVAVAKLKQQWQLEALEDYLCLCIAFGVEPTTNTLRMRIDDMKAQLKQSQNKETKTQP